METVQRHVTEVALVDPHHLKAAAVALRGPALELTGAAIVAVAVAERDTLQDQSIMLRLLLEWASAELPSAMRARVKAGV